jgi:hypothetical protein
MPTIADSALPAHVESAVARGLLRITPEAWLSLSPPFVPGGARA